jgi:hypothetical protein
MKRSDGSELVLCNSCGTVPIYNESTKLYVCSMCDGPVRYAGDSVKNLELLPPIVRSSASFSKVEMPYATYLLNQELNTYMNMGMRILTARDLERLRKPDVKDLMDPSLIQIANKELQTLVLPDTVVPEMITPVEKIEATPEDLRQLGLAQPEAEAPVPQEEQSQQQQPQQPQGMPVNVVLQNTMQPQQQMPQAFNYRVVGEAQPSSSIEADDLSAFPLQMPPQMQQPSVNINIQPQQQQPQTNAVLVPSAIPGAPPTLVVDTSPPAMQATGLPPLPMQQPRQANNVNRRTPPRSTSQPQVNNGPSVAASTVPPATKVNVIKQG